MNKLKYFFHPAVALLTTLVLFGWTFQSVTERLDGAFVYPLDDPYIHLSIAETMREGGYGINSTEFSSPSSSILYPLILAALLSFGFEDLTPLGLCLAAAMLTAWLFGGLYRDRFAAVTGSRLSDLAILPLLVIAANIPGLVFTGMEHSLHLLAVLATTIGLVALAEGKGVTIALALGIVLSPLLRFEGVALSGAALLVLPFFGKLREMIVLGAVLVACMAGYVIAMQGLGLPVLPSSVLTKSSVSVSAVDGALIDAIKGVLGQLVQSLKLREAMPIAFVIGLMTLLLSMMTIPRPLRLGLGIPVLTALAGHMLAGQFGWFYRYESYAVALGLFALIALGGAALQSAAFYNRVLVAALIILIAIPASWYFRVYRTAPYASRDIFTEQYLMHRFATEYFSYPVAVNDIGLVSYKNENYVLDLWGLASEEARRARANGGLTPEETAALADKHDIVFAMAYQSWLGASFPEEWCTLAKLHTIQIIDQLGPVDFLLVDLDRMEEMEAALDAFAKILPDDTSMTRHSCQDPEDQN